MNEDETRLLQEMVELIVREVDPETIILFGSRARGDARPDSDVDLLVVESGPFSPRRSRLREINRLYMALRHMPVPTDVLLYTRDEFDRWKTSLNHVIGRAYREGKVLHERH
jgi:predicted nucleotidyltransferase